MIPVPTGVRVWLATDGIEPRADLADVITRIVSGHPQSRLNELLPWAYPTTPALRAVA